MQQKINRIIFLVLGIIIGIGGTMFFSSHSATTPTVASSIQFTTDQKNTSVLVEALFQNKVDSLMQSNSTLNRRVSSSKTELQKAKQDNKVLLGLVDTLLVHAAITTDTATKLAQCDSLSETIFEFIVSTNTKDSLYEDITTTLQAQVNNKDTVISTQREQYNCLKLSFDKSLAQQDLLSGENLLLGKQIKTHKIKNKLLSAGVVILSGIAVYQFLHH